MRVGDGGDVLGLEFDPGFVAIAGADAAPNTLFVQGDAYRSGLPEGAFDLVHTRFLASTAGQPERLVTEAVRLARPGGFVAYQEAAFHTLKCYPPHPAWEKLARLFTLCFPQPDSEAIAYQIYRLLRSAGLEDVRCRPCLLAVRAGDEWRDYLPSTVESMRGTITGRLGVPDVELDRLLADCRAHLAQPDTVFTPYTCVQSWARKPRR